MPDEADLTLETPEVEVDSEPTGTPTPPDASEHSEDETWERRYKDAQAELTPLQQELAEYRNYIEKLRSDEEVQRSVLKDLAGRFGYQLPEDEEAYQDPGERALAEIEALKQQQAEAERQRKEEEAFTSQMEDFFDSVESFQEKHNIELSERAIRMIGANVVYGGTKPDEALNDWLEEQKAAYEQIVSSKRAPRAPKGGAGTLKFDPSNPDEVSDAALAAAQEALSEME